MKNIIIETKCIDMSIDGQGICKHEGLVIFVKSMIKGEVAKVKIIAKKKNLAYGIIDELITPSPYRRCLDCKVAYKCGGCDLRHIDYEYGLSLKKDILVNTFREVDTKVVDIVKCDDTSRYRNKVQVPVKEDKMGFYRKYSNDIVECDDCLIQSITANNILLTIKAYLKENKLFKYFRHILIKEAKGTNEIMVGLIVNDFNINGINELKEILINEYKDIKSIILNLNTRDDNVILGNEEKVIYGENYITDEFKGIKVHIGLKSFYQTNYYQMIKLYDEIKRHIDRGSRVLDLYSGIGTIGLCLADVASNVIGVEIVKEAVFNANENAKLNGITNAEFHLMNAKDVLNDYLINTDIVVVDPPRKGLNKELINKFIETKVKKIIYVSCNPATLARDLKELSNYYKLSDIKPFDMFPYTNHVECLTVLEKK